jgi:hypothetical protein
MSPSSILLSSNFTHQSSTKRRTSCPSLPRSPQTSRQLTNGGWRYSGIQGRSTIYATHSHLTSRPHSGEGFTPKRFMKSVKRRTESSIRSTPFPGKEVVPSLILILKNSRLWESTKEVSPPPSATRKGACMREE